MFNVFRSREKSVRYLLGAVLTVVALSMVVTLVPNYGGYGSSKDANVLAEIGDETLTQQEVALAVAREIRNGQIPRGMESVYIPVFVDEMISSMAEAYQAQRMGLAVNDEQLAQTIKTMIPQLFEGGKFVGKDAYASILAAQNMSIEQFESNMRKETLRSRLEAVALEGTIVSPTEVENEFRRRNEKIKIGYFSIKPEAIKAKITLSPAEIQAYFAAHRASFQVPEKKSYLIYALDEARVAATIQLPEADLKKAYAENQERFRTPERVKASHILLMTKDKPASEVPAIQKKLEDILKQVRGGANFAELAKKNSEDPGSAVKGGDLGWVTRGQMVPEFEKATFEAKKGEVTNLVKTVYGFHIIKIEEHEQARLRPFEEVKTELAAELGKAQVNDKLQRAADDIRSALVKDQAAADKIAASAGVTAAKAEKVGPQDPIQEVGVSPIFNEAVAKLPKNGVSSVIALGPSKLVVAKVTEVFAAHPAELADVEKQVRDTLLDEKSQQLTKTQVDDIAAKIKAGNSDVQALAKSLGFDYKTSDLVTRDGAITGVGGASIIDPVFSKNVGDAAGPFRGFEGVIFVKVLEKQAADLTQLAASRAQMTEELKRSRAQQRVQLIRDGILKQLVKEKKVKIYSDNIKKFAARYTKS